MHQYLKAIGFDKIRTRNDLKKILNDVQDSFNHQTIVSYHPGKISVKSAKITDNVWEYQCAENWTRTMCLK